jgi:putative endonuclease
MDYFVYIIQSAKSGVFYKGYTSYPVLRLEEYNKGLSHYTANKGPWEMVYLEKMPDKRTALIREKQLKRVNSNYINWLINQESNIINQINFPL